MLSSQQRLYRNIIRSEQLWQMDYNHNWERGESIVLAAEHLLCLWCKRRKEVGICHLLQCACRITICFSPSLLLGGNESARRVEERRRSSDFIIPKQMVQNEAGGGGGGGCSRDLRVANLTLDLHWSSINTSPLEENMRVQTDWRPACTRQITPTCNYLPLLGYFIPVDKMVPSIRWPELKRFPG